ncbi:MAG TPA: hypothetical protein VMU51_07700, partial [Mycobacteriales bacterium]|nr:hypothetical protein [Mycobacteriales bacterium]
MADQSSYPQNDGEWTYDVALNAVTGASFDITKPAAPDDGWFTWKNWDANGADIWYKLKVFFHWDTLYALNYNTKALKAWGAAVDGIEAISNEVRSGNYGQMSVQSLYDFETLVATAGDWLNNESADFHKFATDLKDPNSGVQGSAGDVIAERLKHYGDWLDDLHTQLTTKNGVGVPSAVQSAHDALTRFGSNMADAWEYGGSAPVWSYLSAFPGLHIDWWTDQVYDFTDRAIGSHRGSGHSLNYYRGRLSQFPGPDGTPLDITTQATWDALSNDITTRLKHEIKGWLDGPAVQAMTNLRQAYEASSTALVALVAPAIPPISMPGAGAGAGDPGLGAPGGPPDAAAGMPGGLDPGAGPAGGPDAGAGAPGGLGPVDTAAGPAGGLPDLGGGPPGGPVDVAAGPAGGFDPGAGALDGLGPVDTAAGLPGGLPDLGGPPGGPDVAAGPAGGLGGLIPGVGPGLVGTAPPPPSTTDRPGQNVLGPPPRGTANGQSLPSDAAQGLHPAIPGANGPAGPHLPELRSPAPGGARAGGQ